MVNGEPITDFDIAAAHQADQLVDPQDAARKEVIEELIDDKLKIARRKRFGIEVTTKRTSTPPSTTWRGGST